MRGSPVPVAIVLLLTLVFVAVLVRTAWISDDALISLRTVLNVTHGFGLTFNIAERVQTFTHPLWLLLLTAGYLVAGNVYVATFALSMGVSLVVFWIAVRGAFTVPQAWLIAVVLLFSRAFVDFSTSGLENPLSNLLLAAFVGVALRPQPDGRPRLATLWTLASLLYLTRPDDVLFVAPALVGYSFRADGIGRAARAIAIGLSPAVAWTLFAVIYYGFPFPNTAYAKLATGIHPSEIHRQGILYFFDSIDRDPITLTAIVLGVGMGLITRGLARQLAIGIVLYLAYVVSIGGDFMAGRFLALPLFAATLVLAWLAVAEARTWVVAAGVLGAVGLASAQIPLLSDSRFDATAVKPSGTVDERAVYFRTHSLVLARRRAFSGPTWPRADEPADEPYLLETCGLMGVSGLDFGPYTHLLDECALADPLLARLPAVFNHEWRSGHFRRMIPLGYRESLESGRNELHDIGLRRYYEQIRIITRSPRLFSRERLSVIWRVNTGADDHLIDRRYYRHAGSLVPLDALALVVADETPVTERSVRRLDKPLAVTVTRPQAYRSIEISLDSNDTYLLFFLLDNRIVDTMELGPIPVHRRGPGLATYRERLPLAAIRQGFDTIVVSPSDGEAPFALGHILLDDDPADAELAKRVAQRDGGAPQ